MHGDDSVVQRVMQAKALAEQGEREEARGLFASLWTEVASSGDAVHACVVAHFMAHAQDAEPAQLDWHLRALRAADAVGDDRVQGFYPSLHANLSDIYLRMGDLGRAQEHVERARETGHVLADDGYGRMVRSLIDRLTAELARVAAVETSVSPRATGG